MAFDSLEYWFIVEIISELVTFVADSDVSIG